MRSPVRSLVTCVVIIASAVPVRAQSPGAVMRRDRDTVIIRGAGGLRVPIDSIRVLFRALQQEEFGSPAWERLTRRLDSLMLGPYAAKAGVMMRAPKVFEMAGMPLVKGWIGLEAQGPWHRMADSTGQHITYLAYPAIISVEPESPAGRAGIAPGDMLIAYDGIDVVGHDFNLTKMFVPDRRLDVRVRRDGEPRDYTITVAKAPERIAMRAMPVMPPGMEIRGGSGQVFVMPAMPAMPSVPREAVGAMRSPMLPGNIFIISRDGAFGAHMSTVGPELAHVLNLTTGVLVNQIIENSPAASAGLRVGDVVVSVDSRAVASMEDLRALVQASMYKHEIPLRVVRDRKQHDLTVKW